MTQPPTTPGLSAGPAAAARPSAYGESRSAKRPAPYKNPTTAAVIGAMSPGSGQLWVGDLNRGLLMFGLSFLCGVGYIWGIVDAYTLAKKANRGEFPATDKYVIHALVTLPTVLVVILTGLGAYLVWREWHLLQEYFRMLFRIVS